MTIENDNGCDISSSVDENSRRIVVGVCAMSKKAHSKPMKEILKRLSQFPYIQVVIFEESMILYDPIEEWPLCDSLISFYSGGFPLDKAIAYARYRKPHLINDLESQYMLMDRQRVYEALKDNDVPVPRYSVLRRRSNGSLEGHKLVIHEHDDALEVDGNTFTKPFVEKPVDAEDHNIHIYFPHSAGGGSVRLFRKTDNRSSMYMKETNNIRQYGSYIYEEFMPTDGTDVKVYTVGDDYAHAEARKSPALDGRVERDSEGKEVRYPVILTPREKIIAKKVCQASRQQICGFDLLRANGMSYVCDVNGFSFVKSSKKYYDDCGHILGVMITRAVAPTLSIPVPRPLDNPPLVPTTYGTIMELRCVIAVIRHGDRTPKQKMKMEVKHPKFFEIFTKYDGYRMGELKLKKPKQLQELLDVCRSLLLELESGNSPDPEIEEKKSKLHQLRYVLELYGHFSGINRKVQFKYQPHGRPKRYSDEETTGEPSLLMVVKWGGELTDAGKQQAESLGRAFRCIYPGGDGNYGKDPGLGLLRLHSTYRHDLKIYASDEGRVQMTAAAFARGFLALEGELPPILAQMVKSAHTNGLLDSDNDCRKYQRRVKKKIAAVMSKETPFDETDYHTLAPNGSISLLNAMKVIGSPVRMCRRVQALVGNLVNRICQQHQSRRREPRRLYHGETWDLLQRRWCKLDKDFKCPDGGYDFSKVSDIYDNIKYDLQHNSHILDPAEGHELYQHAKYLADLIVPQEYGITKEEKLLIGQRICTPLMRKILADARYTDVEDTFTRLNSEYSKDVASPDRFVRTRLYFTSESHIHSLLTCLRFGGLSDPQKDEQWRRAMEYVSAVPELNYLSQIVIMIYEDPSQTSKTDERFHVELHFSPGAITVCKDLPRGSGYRPQSRERRPADNVSNSEGNTNPSTPGPTESFSSTDIAKPQFILGDDDDDPGELSDDEEEEEDDDVEAEEEADVEVEVERDPEPEPELSAEVATDACEVDETDEDKQIGKIAEDTSVPSTTLSRSDSQVASDTKAVVTNRNKYKIGRFECEDALVDDEIPQISTATPTAARRHPKLVFGRRASESIDRRRGSGGESELSTDVSPVALDLNYLTYPGHAYPYPNLFALGVSKAGSSEMVNPRSVPNQGHLISTAVISGSNTMLPGSASSNSAPDLQKVEDDNLNVNGPALTTLMSARRRCLSNSKSSDDIVTPSAPSVPDVYPLETLHNALTLHQLENFLEGLITTKMETPWASPVPPSTPSRSGAISRVELRSSIGDDANTSSEPKATVFDTLNNEGYILSRLEELIKHQSKSDKDVS